MKVVVVTGGSKGLGFCLAEEFARRGYTTVIGARNAETLARAQEAIERRLECAGNAGVSGVVHAFELDVGDAESIERFIQRALDAVEPAQIDVWVNNAGSNSNSREPIFAQTPSQVANVADTNLKGTLLCCRAAIRLMRDQPSGGHIFNTDGAGVFGTPTKGYAAYGATKRAMPQLMLSLNEELREAKVQRVGVHTISPGLVLTDLLLAGSTPLIRVFFNFLAEEPETVAAWLAPRILATTGRGRYHKFLRLPVAFLKIATGVVLRRNRYFDSNGERVVRNSRERFAANGVRDRLAPVDGDD